MKIQDNFCGTKSLQKVALAMDHKCVSLDNNKELNPDICADILDTDPGSCDYAHFSPPCTGFSVASIGKHWTGGYRAYIPKTSTALLGIKLLDRVAYLISINKYKYWTIENPMGVFRKVMPDILKKHGITDYKMITITYCQYGDKRMKPTDFFTNIPNFEGKRCKNGMSCHESAPRGSKTGTQGLKNAKERGVIPERFFIELIQHLETLNNGSI